MFNKIITLVRLKRITKTREKSFVHYHKKYRMHLSYQTVVLTSPLMDVHYHIKDARPHEFFLSKSCINITIDGPTLPHKDACSTTHAFFLSNSCLDITINGPALFKYSMLFKGDMYLKSKDWNFC